MNPEWLRQAEARDTPEKEKERARQRENTLHHLPKMASTFIFESLMSVLQKRGSKHQLMVMLPHLYILYIIVVTYMWILASSCIHVHTHTHTQTMIVSGKPLSVKETSLQAVRFLLDAQIVSKIRQHSKNYIQPSSFSLVGCTRCRYL